MGNVLYDNRVARLSRDYDMRMTQIVYIDPINNHIETIGTSQDNTHYTKFHDEHKHQYGILIKNPRFFSPFAKNAIGNWVHWKTWN